MDYGSSENPSFVCNFVSFERTCPSTWHKIVYPHGLNCRQQSFSLLIIDQWIRWSRLCLINTGFGYHRVLYWENLFPKWMDWSQSYQCSRKPWQKYQCIFFPNKSVRHTLIHCNLTQLYQNIINLASHQRNMNSKECQLIRQLHSFKFNILTATEWFSFKLNH